MDNRRKNGGEFYEEGESNTQTFVGDARQDVAHARGALFSKASIFFFCLAVFLLPFIFLPIEGFSLQSSKFLIVAFLLIVSGIAHLSSEQGRGVKIPRTLFSIIGFLSIFFVFSALLSESFNASLIGGFQGGSLYVLLVGLLAAGLGALVISTPGRLLLLFMSLLSGVGLLAIFHVVRLIFGPEVLSFGILTTATATPAGSWYDLGALFAIVYLIALTGVVFGTLQPRLTTVLTALIFVSLFFLALTHLVTLLIILILLTATLFLFALREKVQRGRPLMILATTFLTIAIIFAGPINSFFGSIFGTDYVEVRPSWQSTLEVGKSNVLNPKNFLLGNGPNTFSLLWQDDRNQVVVESDFWVLDFAFATSTFATYIMTLGVLMGVFVLSWFIYFVVLLSSLRREKTKIDPFTFVSLRVSFLVSLFILLFGSLYVFGVVHFLLLCILSGVAMGTYARLEPKRIFTFRLSRENNSYFFGTCILLFSIAATHLVLLGMSSVLYGQTMSQVRSIETATDFDSINSKLRIARFIDRSDKLERARAESALLEMQFLSNLDESQLTEETQSRFVRAIEVGAESALAATKIDPRNYLNWITGGYVFETLGELSVQNGHDQAARYYAQARLEHPTNPEIPLIQARLELAREDAESARAFARESIEMKRSYSNAYTFLAQVELESGREAQALAVFEEGVLANPNSTALHYELGALHYRFGNFNKAVESFGRAITLDPAYANALYFRGLALYYTGDRDSSLSDLEKVLSTNENNQDLIRVVNNVRANRNPLMGLDQSGEGTLPNSETLFTETNAGIVGDDTDGGLDNVLNDMEGPGQGDGIEGDSQEGDDSENESNVDEEALTEESQ